jgi:hypothetical protein
VNCVNPITPNRFVANLRLVVNTTVGTFNTELTQTGEVGYDYFLQTQKAYFTNMVIKATIPPLPASIITDTTAHWMLSNHIIRREFNWTAQKCGCSDVDGDFPARFLTTDATSTTTTTIISPDSATPLSVTAYTVVMAKFDSSADTTITIYVDANNKVRRTFFEISFLGFSITTTEDFWNVLDLSVVAQVGHEAQKAAYWTPPTYCNGKCRDRFEVPTGNFSAPPPATIPRNCKLPLNTSLTFCAGIVGTYLIPKAHIEASTDAFVAAAFAGTNGAVQTSGGAALDPNTGCGREFKIFLCRFYFPICRADGLTPGSPPASWNNAGCSSSQTAVLSQSSAASSFATTNNQNQSSSTTTGAAASIVPSFVSIVFFAIMSIMLLTL